MLDLLQRGLEGLYRIETTLDVRDFMIDQAAREALGVVRQPREQLLLSERDGDLQVGLFVDDRALANLQANDPRDRLDARNLGDFLLTVEGVSHFVYLVWRARAGRQVSAFELELQAEIDKYVTCLLTTWPQTPSDLRSILFERFELEAGLDREERDRYLAANANARTYAASLDTRFVARGALSDMLDELRRFYRLGAAEKLSHIVQAA